MINNKTVFKNKKGVPMPFIIEQESLTIKGRRGDSAMFTFELDTTMNLTGACLHFYVKRNINDSDDKVIIKKEYNDLSTKAISIILTSEDTSKLLVQNNSYAEYYWGLKIHNGIEFAQTLIPSEFKSAPKLIVYPEIVGG